MEFYILGCREVTLTVTLEDSSPVTEKALRLRAFDPQGLLPEIFEAEREPERLSATDISFSFTKSFPSERELVFLFNEIEYVVTHSNDYLFVSSIKYPL